MPKLTIGDPAPDFTLEGTAGPFTLSDHRGRRIVLLFYPGDDTPVCTKQFCSYRDHVGDEPGLDAVLVGISTGDVAAKASFAAKHGLTTPLLADDDGTVAKAYGVFSSRLGVTKRAVVIVGEDGTVAHKHANFLSLGFDSLDDIRAALAAVPVRA